MVEITFLEIHLDDSEFTANASAPFGPGEKEVEAGGDPPDHEDASRAGAALAAVVGLVFVLAVAYVAKRRFLDGGDETPLDEEFDEEFDVAA
jgi:hypothetical protein